MTGSPSAATRLIALLGDPISHSLSPRFQNAAFHAAGVDGVYLALRCGAEELGGLISGIARAGGGGNVTLPHKAAAADLVERSTPAVERTGACNTFWLEDGKIWGDNTDVTGVTRAMRDLLGQSPRGARVLLLGAGGAARATTCALVDEGAAEIVLCNRTLVRAESIAGAFPEARDRILVVGSPAALKTERFDLVINATTMGLYSEESLPLRVDAIAGIGAGLDLVYRPEPTAWTRYLRSHGIPADDGLGMLIHQGAAAFERWWGIAAPVDAMRDSLGRADADDQAALAAQPR